MQRDFGRLFIFFMTFGCLNAYAAPTESIIELGVYTSNITYTEPSVMQEKGAFQGISGRISFHEKDTFRTVEAYYSSGDVNYVGSGTIDNIPDEIFEVRGLIGRNIQLSSHYQASPYIGLGYRNLNDDSSGLVSSTGAYGYEREQIYIYLPIGFEVATKANMGGWSFSGRIEYDFLLKGTNNSYLSTVGRRYDDITLHQNEGYGYRIGVGITKEFNSGLSLTLEPFYRYWNLEDSEVTFDSRNEGWIEPHNNSKEYGLSLILTI